MTKCHCGSGLDYSKCCEVYISGAQIPDTPEKLMRSRYSAYVEEEINYILETQKDINMDYDDALEWSQDSDWLGLDIIKASIDESESFGRVEFIAKYEDLESKFHAHHEISNFKKIDGKWFYMEGFIVDKNPIARDTRKLGRNEPCLCGSGKKYKKCCGR